MRKLEILRHNLRTINLINKIITLILTGLLITNYIFTNIIQTNSSPISFAGRHYIYVIVFNILIYYIMNIRRVKFTKENLKSLELFTGIYVTLIITMGAFVSLRDTDGHNPLLIYTFILLICSSFLVLTFFQILVPMFISITVLIVGLYLLNGIDAVFYMQVIYLFSIAFIAFLLTRYNKESFEKTIQYQIEMKREARNNRELTKKLREVNRKLELQLLLDPLTNLFNRRAYNDYIKELQNRTKNESFTVSVVMLDVDCFKQYNDTYGHYEGDNVLMKIGEVLQEISELYNCFVARWGGEEFSIIIANQSPTLTEQICNEIVEKIKELKIEHTTSNVDKYVTVSIGAFTKMVNKPKDIVDCVNGADKMLYEVKESGRDNFIHKQEENVAR